MKKRIKLLFTFLFIASIWQAALGQQNVIKGRAIILPIPQPYVYSLGIGYERIVSQHMAVQILLNNYGYNMRSSNRIAEFFTGIIPETRYYFNAEKKMSSFYSAAFLELLRRKRFPSSEHEDLPLITRKQVSPGLLIGKNIRLPHGWHLELYAGVKYRYTWREHEYTQPDLHSFSFRYRWWGARTGMNLAISF